MALTKTLTQTNNFGVESTIPDAYIRVDEVCIGKTSAVASVGVYSADKTKLLYSVQHSFAHSVNDPTNSIAQAYQSLKTSTDTPQYADAVDC
jgi:hypothetical protein